MSGPVARAFLDNIVADIDDDATRLVFSDWLEENRQHERAEFIRVQVERAHLPAWDAAQVRLRLREQELLKEHGESWLAEMPKIKGARWEGFRRGIVAEVSFSSFEALRANAHACRAAAPVEAVTVRWPRRRESKEAIKPIAELRELTLTGRPLEDEVFWLADSPQLSTLRVLNVLGLSAENLTFLVASPHLGRLRTLRLTSSGLGVAGVQTLTKGATLMALEELDLSGSGQNDDYNEDGLFNTAGMEALAGWTGLTRVRSLTLSGSDVRPAGLRALLRSPHVRTLKALSLRGGRLDGQAMGEFNDAQPELRLETLDVGENVLKELGAEYVARARCLRELKDLRLDRCEIPLTGARQLAKKASFVDGLRILEVGHNHFGPAGLEALLERKPPSLHTLRMRDNNLADEGAALLAASPASNSLLELDFSQNDMGRAAAQALGSSAYLGRLLVLRLADNAMNESAISTLATSPLGRRLSILE